MGTSPTSAGWPRGTERECRGNRTDRPTGCHKEGTLRPSLIVTKGAGARHRALHRGSRALNSTVKTLFLWMAIFGVVILLWNTFQGGKAAQKEMTFSDFIDGRGAGRGVGGHDSRQAAHRQVQRQGRAIPHPAGQEFKTRSRTIRTW